MKAILTILIAVLTACSGVSAINAYEVSVFGAKANMPPNEINAFLKALNFVPEGVPKKDSRGALRTVYRKGKTHFVNVIVFDGMVLEINGSEFLYRGSRVKLGQPKNIILKLLGKADSQNSSLGPDGIKREELRYRDNEHLVPFSLEFHNGKLYKFVLAPGPDAYSPSGRHAAQEDGKMVDTMGGPACLKRRLPVKAELQRSNKDFEKREADPPCPLVLRPRKNPAPTAATRPFGLCMSGSMCTSSPSVSRGCARASGSLNAPLPP